MSLPTPAATVETLQTSLQAKAKAEPAFRFYALWDKVCRKGMATEPSPKVRSARAHRMRRMSPASAAFMRRCPPGRLAGVSAGAVAASVAPQAVWHEYLKAVKMKYLYL